MVQGRRVTLRPAGDGHPPSLGPSRHPHCKSLNGVAVVRWHNTSAALLLQDAAFTGCRLLFTRMHTRATPAADVALAQSRLETGLRRGYGRLGEVEGQTQTRHRTGAAVSGIGKGAPEPGMGYLFVLWGFTPLFTFVSFELLPSKLLQQVKTAEKSSPVLVTGSSGLQL